MLCDILKFDYLFKYHLKQFSLLYYSSTTLVTSLFYIQIFLFNKQTDDVLKMHLFRIQYYPKYYLWGTTIIIVTLR